MITKAQVDEWESHVAALHEEIRQLRHRLKESDVIIVAYETRLRRLASIPGVLEAEEALMPAIPPDILETYLKGLK